MNKEELISISNLNKLFLTEEVETHALNDINLTINSGEYLTIVGPSGCGKSTLLSIMGLLDNPTNGRYILNGKDVSHLNRNEQAVVRNETIGFIFQSFNLISDLSVEANIELPLTYRKDLSKSQRKEMVQKALQDVNMDHRTKHFPSQLSGGQQQRVAIARAIAGQPKILLADEPTGNLDSKNAEAIVELLDELNQKGTTICIVTHDPRSVENVRRHVRLHDGKILTDDAAIDASVA